MFNVFLNHRGPDVKKDFVAHLHEALFNAGLHPFTDMESLVKGQHGQTSIYEALGGASVHVAVFSKGYADSTFCLDELCAMLESKKRVIPVFYDVSPDDLKCTNKLQNGAYANAFRKTHKKQPQAQVEKWKKALYDAAELFGFRLADYNGNAARLKKDVVIAVQNALPFSAHLQPVAKYAVGLDQSSRSVIETLNQMGDNVGVLSVVGMGGIGKTTLAWEVFLHFAMNDTRKFEKQSFLKNVRESPVLDLQKQLVRDLLQEDVKSREDFNRWFNLFMGRKVLIVIDDIDEKLQFEQLIPEINKLARGSRVLITSRDRNLVANIMEKAECKYASHEVAALDNPDARQLFNSHAFHSSNVTDGFHDVAQRVADACAGLPLALEVIGSLLFDKRKERDLDCWEQTIKTLHEENNILDKLKISYDGLSTSASQLMFLDIACFFIGKHETMAMQIFESCSYDYNGPAASFSSLIDKSLVKLDGDGRIVMHDLLRDMGREVVKKQSLEDKAPRSHLWDPEMAERVLANGEGTNRVRGLSVAGKGNGAACVAENYTSMKKLHFLLLDACDVKGDFSTWSLELSWLQWRSSPLSALPLKLDLLKLAVLDLTDSKSLTRISPSDSELEELQTLILENCCALEELPQNFGKLSRLKDLNMRGCSTLEALPDSMGQLRELEHLNLSSCGKLGSLPDSIVHLSKLKTIQLNECTQLKSLPMAFGELQSLVEFRAEGSSLSHLPHTFSSLSNLEHLHLYKCSHIQDLPPSMKGFGRLQALVELDLGTCSIEEKGLSSDFGNLSALRTLRLQYNKLATLPETFRDLGALVFLEVHHCPNLIDVQALPWNLEHMDIGDCPNLTDIPFLGKMSLLKCLRLCNCTRLTQLQGLESLPSLVEINVAGCTMLENVSGLNHNRALERCYLSGSKISMKYDNDWLKSLQYLDICDCPKLMHIPSLDNLSLLRSLTLCKCTKLTQIQGLHSLTSVVEVNLTGCTMLQNAPGLNHNNTLEKCYLRMFNVFLNHRGPDVKMNFVAHLHEALLQARLHPFTDMESLVQGQPGQPSIYEALRGASVHVAVFSRGYADSTYCLDELCAMLESKKLLIPVFYDVSPGDLKCTNELQNGAYANAFRETHKNQPQAQVEKWKKALSDAAELNGFRLANYNGHEARLKQDIVIAVQKALPSSAHLQPVAKYAVGLDQSSTSVIETLNQMGDNVGVLSVVGMGGIGKTTLAKEVFNHFAKNDTSKFEKQSFLKNVRESPVLDLQKQLVRDLLQKDVESREDFNKWFNLFMGRKVLIVIDDIDKKPQFEQLIPEINKLARGSRVLITSRDRNLVANIMERAECKYARHEVAALNNSDARQLFNSHAFHSSNVTDGFHDVAQRVADACAGLPLALEVIGSFLFDKRNEHDLDCWEQTIKTLHEEKDILDKLKISYDASFRSLVDKSLVKLDGDGRIVMHDLLRDMGREVVKNQSLMDEAPPSHLWDPEIAERVLAHREGTNRVRGLSVAGKGNGAACVAENYTSMNQLQFLLLDGCDVKGDFSTWSLELSWLQWRSSPLSSLPLKLDLLKLAVLDLTDSKSLTRIWPSDSELEELQTLILENCSALEELPQNFGKLSRLKNLNMRGCSTLEALPDSMGQLRELEHLNLSGCGKLGSLPDSIVHLSKLKTIHLNECTQLKSLPMAFGELQSLVEFSAERSSLSHLPHTFSSLSNLEHLHLYKCSHIQDLPPSMSGLGKLKVLHMGQTRVQTLPEDFGKLGSLIELNLQECESLKSLPNNFELLSELRKLSLQYLDICDCPKLMSIPSLDNLSLLRSLTLCKCTKLTQIQGLDSLTSVVEVNLTGCTMLQN
ncbi:unnamed protein product, partial [Sphagnum jensenii]